MLLTKQCTLKPQVFSLGLGPKKCHFCIVRESENFHIFPWFLWWKTNACCQNRTAQLKISMFGSKSHTYLMQMLLFSVPNDSICLFLLWPSCFFATALLDAFVFGFIFMSCDSGRVRHVFICVNLCENIREFGFEI